MKDRATVEEKLAVFKGEFDKFAKQMLPALLGGAADKLNRELDQAMAEVERWTNAKQERPVAPVLPPNPQPMKPS